MEGTPVEETSIDAVIKRAKGEAVVLEKCGRSRDAGELRRQVASVELLDEWHRHASDLETLAGLCRAVRAFDRQAQIVVD